MLSQLFLPTRRAYMVRKENIIAYPLIVCYNVSSVMKYVELVTELNNSVNGNCPIVMVATTPIACCYCDAFGESNLYRPLQLSCWLYVPLLLLLKEIKKRNKGRSEFLLKRFWVLIGEDG